MCLPLPNLNNNSLKLGKFSSIMASMHNEIKNALIRLWIHAGALNIELRMRGPDGLFT